MTYILTAEQKEHKRIYNKEWGIINKEHKNKYNRNYHFINRDKILERKRKYLEILINKENHRRTNSLWVKNNPLRMKIKNHKNNYKRLSQTKDLTYEIIQNVYENNIKKYGTLTCYLCLKSILFGDDNLEHKIPLSRGGGNKIENLDIAHKLCNQKKGNKTVEEFIKKEI